MTATCPRCFAEIGEAAEVQFCPHCGLPGVIKAALDREPLLLKVGDRSYRVLDRLAIGSLASVYRCEVLQPAEPGIGIFKIARDPCSNSHLSQEARVLRQMGAAPNSFASKAFIPRAVDTFDQRGSDLRTGRTANVLKYHAEIRSPDDLYTLEEVRNAYPDGLDAKDVAWIWRRLLNVLSFAHLNGVVHTAVLPVHVLIEPADHKLVLIDWCFAATAERWHLPAKAAGTGGKSQWFMREGVPRVSSPALDISQGARCMMFLLAGTEMECPPTLDPAIRRHFERCIDLPDQMFPSASELLLQFDRLIDALWGARQFRQLTMPLRT